MTRDIEVCLKLSKLSLQKAKSANFFFSLSTATNANDNVSVKRLLGGEYLPITFHLEAESRFLLSTMSSSSIPHNHENLSCAIP